MLHYLAIATLSTYIIAALFFLADVYSDTRSSKSRIPLAKIAGYLFYLAFGLHTILFMPVFTLYESPMPESRGEYLFWFSWAVSLIYILAGKYVSFPLIGAFVAPIAAFFLSASSYLSHQGNLAGTSSSKILLLVHVAPAFMAELSLVFAFIISSVYLVQSKRLKRRQAVAISSPAPSLRRLEIANQKVLLFGFACMTIAIISGVLWAISSGGVLFSRDLYQWLALCVWLVTAMILHARINIKCSASKMAKLTVCFCLILIAGMFIASLIQGNIIHKYAI